MKIDSEYIAIRRNDGEDTLILGNSQIRRTWNWNDGQLITKEIKDVVRGISVKSKSREPDLFIPNLTDEKPLNSSFNVVRHAGTNLVQEHVEAIVETDFNNGTLRRSFKIFAGVPAIKMTLWARFKKTVVSRMREDADFKDSIEDDSQAVVSSSAYSVMDKVPIDGVHWKAVSAEFRDATDHCNNLVEEHSIFVFTQKTNLVGNILFLNPFITDSPSLFVVKESPCGAAQLDWCGHDFAVARDAAEITGSGFTEESIEGWVRGYGCAVGVAGNTDAERLKALRSYQKCLRVMLPERDNMVLMNTWGDRGRDGRLRESFALLEIEVAKELGVTHFQLDDGWQKGLSHNSAFEGGEFPDLARRPDFWEPHPERFPNGLAPVIEHGRKNGIDICLWFNPSSANDYESWEADAEVLISLYRKYGVTVFKIDGVTVATKLGEMRLRKMLEKVQNVSSGKVVFNLDVTAGRRFGYHYFYEYGNIFLENRYTDWGNWYPSWTFRNLWQLSKYIPPERIQAEFLNNMRNTDMYSPEDVLAPTRVPFDTALAITLAGQPLAWFEGTGLQRGDSFNRAAELLSIYKKISNELHSGIILPTGDEPYGFSLSGFISLDNESGGWLIIIREAAACSKARVQVYMEPGTCVSLEPLCNEGVEIRDIVDEDGCIGVEIPEKWSYEIWRMSLELPAS
ncbi:MAG: alpha-galactosidase [Lentisphaerae bacterium]|jgi:alpha-galactosidase|nr:alpha-galactosidase [Lentisphaerota bacterium]